MAYRNKRNIGELPPALIEVRSVTRSISEAEIDTEGTDPAWETGSAWNQSQFGEPEFIAEPDGQLTIATTDDEKEPPDPDDFPNREDFETAWSQWETQNPPAQYPELRGLNLGEITRDLSCQPRVKMDVAHIKRLAEAIEEGIELEPLVVFGEENFLADGFHRSFAYDRAGVEDVMVRWYPGTLRDAQLYSLGANAEHQILLPRSNADKRNAVVRMLQDSEWAGWSDGAIAKQCRVSQPFVSKLRKEAEPTQNVMSSGERKYSRNGKTQVMQIRQRKVFAPDVSQENKPEDSPPWNPDDWETPDNVAEAMSRLILPSDRRILEPSAGTGQIAKFLPCDRDLVCVEQNTSRFSQGKDRSPGRWVNSRFPHGAGFSKEIKSGFDLVIGNPPFSEIIDFLVGSLQFLNLENPDARILFLLPLDWNCSIARGTTWQTIDARIHNVYPWRGRIAYLKNGEPEFGRQVCDAVFDIRPGKDGGCFNFLNS
ncbi:MAG TPA: ParB N-terminal domain-containing protein [Oscillatoriales cyanobacterium M59_W2019_021]|nr:MAG: hypothetical protein D6728_19410 [Cyanobacteria bacterium J055]HIK29899.1 ParB N-terminal domain-containing protein [Oscillatoriales cyanobacterium M4454_W2019_049]HIK49415.1 ParB N-terminal domain-containing protein [Oscillatoriales cyanobacterium M59_W2019_021]